MKRWFKILKIRCLNWMMKDGWRIAVRDGDWWEAKSFERKHRACEKRLEQLGYYSLARQEAKDGD